MIQIPLNHVIAIRSCMLSGSWCFLLSSKAKVEVEVWSSSQSWSWSKVEL